MYKMSRRLFLISFCIVLSTFFGCKKDVGKIEDETDEDDFLIRLQNANRSFTSGREEMRDQLLLVWFSDIHNDIARAQRLLNWKSKYSKYIDDVIFNGDLAGLTYASLKSEFFKLKGFDKVLMVLGNHDVYDYAGVAPFESYGNVKYWASQEDAYRCYFRDIAKWNVIQPQYAGASDYPCYYYKDYPAANIRLIVLDCMFYDEKQAKWFSETLESARQAGLSVVASQHIPERDGLADLQSFDTPFNTLDSYKMESKYDKGARDIVDDFINNGGEFVCWMFGHVHSDFVGTYASHPNQIYICVGSASVSTPHQDSAREVGTNSEDLFNVISFDTYGKVIKVIRIGATFDRYLRKRDTMVISYRDLKLLYSS